MEQIKNNPVLQIILALVLLAVIMIGIYIWIRRKLRRLNLIDRLEVQKDHLQSEKDNATQLLTKYENTFGIKSPVSLTDAAQELFEFIKNENLETDVQAILNISKFSEKQETKESGTETLSYKLKQEIAYIQELLTKAEDVQKRIHKKLCINCPLKKKTASEETEKNKQKEKRISNRELNTFVKSLERERKAAAETNASYERQLKELLAVNQDSFVESSEEELLLESIRKMRKKRFRHNITIEYKEQSDMWFFNEHTDAWYLRLDDFRIQERRKKVSFCEKTGGYLSEMVFFPAEWRTEQNILCRGISLRSTHMFRFQDMTENRSWMHDKELILKEGKKYAIELDQIGMVMIRITD